MKSKYSGHSPKATRGQVFIYQSFALWGRSEDVSQREKQLHEVLKITKTLVTCICDRQRPGKTMVRGRLTEGSNYRST